MRRACVGNRLGGTNWTGLWTRLEMSVCLDGCPRFAKAYLGRKRRGDPDFLYAAMETTACAAFIKESRMKFANATNINRKSGVAEWRDLRFPVAPQKATGPGLRPSRLLYLQR